MSRLFSWTQARVTEVLKVGAETYEGELKMDSL
jgi:hypothetical protein